MSAMEQRAAVGDRLHSVAGLVDRASHWVRFIAQPSLVQLVLRFALAVPFWRSGILKWDGFLQLNDTAVTLFTDEFKLHLPGGPYPFPAPTVMAFLSGCGEITFPVLLVFGLGARFAALGLLFMTLIVELTGGRSISPGRRWLSRSWRTGQGDFRLTTSSSVSRGFLAKIEGADSPASQAWTCRCDLEGLR